MHPQNLGKQWSPKEERKRKSTHLGGGWGGVGVGGGGLGCGVSLVVLKTVGRGPQRPVGETSGGRHEKRKTSGQNPTTVLDRAEGRG